jgi:hypothetical protein
MPFYAEDHSALRWPLVLLGIGLPLIIVASIAYGATTSEMGVMIIVIPAALLWALTDARHLILVWPVGLRLDNAGIRIGGVRRRGRKSRKKLPAPSLQGYQVFTCPWRGVTSLEVVTDRAQLRKLRRRGNGPTTRIKARGGIAEGYRLGMLKTGFMRAALVIEVDPKIAEFPKFRLVQALAVATSQQGTESTTWMVPTRQPTALRAVVEQIVGSTDWSTRYESR